MGNIVKYNWFDYNPKYYSVYFKGVDFSDLENNELPKKGKIILRDVNGNNPDVEISAFSFKINKKTKTWYVHHDNKNIQTLIKDNKKTTSKLNDGEYWLNNNKYWLKGGHPYNEVLGAIMKSIEKIYNGTDLGVGHKWGPNPSDTDKKPMVGVLDFEVATNSKHWSIVNLFNSNPQVRRILLREYGNYLGSGVWSLDDFVKHIFDNREKFFHPNSSVFKELTKANHKTWGTYGVKNEKAAKKYIESYYGDGYTVYGDAEPGLRADIRGGVDVKVINKNGKEDNYQAKPLDSWSVDSDGKWVIKSSELNYYDPNKVEWFIFGPNKNSGGENKRGEFLIFKNEGQHPIDTVTMVFDNKPENFMGDDDYDFSSEDVFPWGMKREPVDGVVESFFNTGKINLKEDWLGGTIPNELYKDTLTVQGRSLTFADIWNMFYPYDNNDYPEFREFREKLKRITLKYVNGDEEIANEITDEIFIKKVPGVFKKNREDPTYFRTFELLKTYIIAIFNNANVDVHRKGKVEKGRRDKYLYEPSSGVGSDNDKKYSDEVVQQAFNNIKNEMWKFLIYNKTIHKTKDDKIKVAKITDMWNEEHNDNVAIATMNTYVQRAKEEFKRQLNIAQKEESRRNTNIFAEHVDNYVDKFLDI